MNKDIRWLAIAFFLVAIALRFMPHWHNFTPMAALALFAGCYLSGRVGLVLAFSAMAFSDLLGHWFAVPTMGFYSRGMMVTVYLAIGLTAVIGRTLQGRVGLTTVPLASLAGSLMFFLTTNFACWLDPIMGYPQTSAGLMQCYVLALPFAMNTFLGDLFFSSLLFGAYALLVRAHLSAQPRPLAAACVEKP